jgi:hypothetical protein
VQVDDETRGTVPLAEPIHVDLGRHLVVIWDGGAEIYREAVKVAGGQTVRIRVGAEAPQPEPSAAEPAVEEQQPEVPADDEEGGERRWTWIALGVGGAVGIAGGVVGGVSLSRKNDLLDDCTDGVCPSSTEKDRDAVKSLSLAADVLYGVAGAALITGVVLFFVEPGLGEGEVTVSPSASANGAGLVLGGRF